MLARQDEQFAKEAFSRFLRRVNPSTPLLWEQGTQAPDFFLTAGGVRYAVEVTRVVGTAPVGGQRLSTRAVQAPLLRFVNELQTEACKRGILQGTYEVWLEPVPNLRQVARSARDRFLGYIARTKEQVSAPEDLVLELRGVKWSIRKHHGQEDCLCLTMSDDSGGWEYEIRKEFTGLFQAAIKRKINTTAKLGEPKILLLVDDYHYADAQLWRNSLQDSDRTTFHTIARAYCDYNCQVLWSIEKAWKCKEM